MNIVVHYISDLHLEFFTDDVDLNLIPAVKAVLKTIEKNDINVLAIAGDLGHPNKESYDKALLFFKDKFDHVIVIKGNHEYYSKLPHTELENIIEEKCKFTGAIYLNNTSWRIPNSNIVFLGTTLWSKITPMGFEAVNDKKFCYKTIEEAKEKHSTSAEWLETQISNANKEDKIIVITHHLPSIKCIHKRYRFFSIYNTAYVANMEHLMKDNVIAWIHGHTHAPIHVDINGVTVVCNPSGYKEDFCQNNYNKYKPIIINDNNYNNIGNVDLEKSIKTDGIL